MLRRGARKKAAQEAERERLITLAQVVKSNNAVLIKPEKVRVLDVQEYGSRYCIIGDSRDFDAWSCKPKLTFVSENAAEMLPTTKLAKTRIFLGSAMLPVHDKVIVNHFQYGESANRCKYIKFSIYHVNENFSCQLTNEISIDAGDVAGSALAGRFTSSAVGTYISVWGDLSNNSTFSVGDLKMNESTVVGDSSAGVVSVREMEPAGLPLGFACLPDVYFASRSTVYTSRAIPVGRAHPRHLVLQVYLTGTSHAAGLSTSFHRVAVLPFECVPCEDQWFDSRVLQYKAVTDSEGVSERYLVQVSLQRVGTAGDCDVTFLLKAPTNEVLDVHVSVDNEDEANCCISADNQRIVCVTTASQARPKNTGENAAVGTSDLAAVEGDHNETEALHVSVTDVAFEATLNDHVVANSACLGWWFW